MTKAFVLYDSRAIEDTEDAAIFDTAKSEDEARKSGIEDWADYDCIWFEYDKNKKGVISNGKARFDLPPFSVNNN